MKWQYGVTCVPFRFNEPLPRTLESLKRAGFDKPRLFIDGQALEPEYIRQYERTWHWPVIRTTGNWFLAAWELWVRDSNADRYILFQDDLVTYPDLREYLEWLPYPDKGYCNLYTFPQNEQPKQGWYPSNQYGRGAVALMFDNAAMQQLLRAEHMLLKTKHVEGYRNVDGGIIESMKFAGYREFVHNPSLVQHTGIISSMQNGTQPLAKTFKGEDYRLMELTQCPESSASSATTVPAG